MKFSVLNLACFQARVRSQLGKGFQLPSQCSNILRNEPMTSEMTVLVHSVVSRSDSWTLKGLCVFLVSFSVPLSECWLSQWWRKLLSMCLLGLFTTIRCGKQAVAEPTNAMTCGITTSHSTLTGMTFPIILIDTHWMIYDVIPVSSYSGNASLYCKNVKVSGLRATSF